VVGRKKVRDGLSQWIGSDGQLGEAPASYYVHIASKFLRMSYTELDQHPQKFDLMRTAFSLQIGIHEGTEIWKKNEASKAKVSGK
jgi:hypothetical protein